MKYATRFGAVAARLRARGLTVVEVAGWQARGHGDFVSVESVTLHHTATGGTADYASLNLVTNGRADLKGPLCNFGVGRRGTIYLVSAGYAWHTGATRLSWQGNKYAVGIEAENNGRGEPWGTPITLAMTALVQELQREFSVPVARVLGHREICSPGGRKIDPTFDLNEFRSRLQTINAITKEAAVAAVDEVIPQGNHYTGKSETLGWVVRELEPRIVDRVTNAVFELEARLSARIDALPGAVVAELLSHRLPAATFRPDGVVEEPTPVSSLLTRAAEASITYNTSKELPR